MANPFFIFFDDFLLFIQFSRMVFGKLLNIFWATNFYVYSSNNAVVYFYLFIFYSHLCSHFCKYCTFYGSS
jgi:hypothetical protein